MDGDVEACLLHEFNSQQHYSLLPVIIFIGCLCAIGSVGNGLAFFVYLTRFDHSNAKCFFVTLSAIEFLSSVVIMPLELHRLWNQYIFRSEYLCKSFVYFNVGLVETSCLLFVIIAIERYRKICHPFGWQMTEKVAQIICLMLFPISLTIAIPSVFIYGPQYVSASVQIKEPGLCVSEAVEPILRNITLLKCTVNNDLQGGTLSKSYASYFTLSTGIFLLIISTCYWKIIRKLKILDEHFKWKSPRKLPLAPQDRRSSKSEMDRDNSTTEYDTKETEENNTFQKRSHRSNSTDMIDPRMKYDHIPLSELQSENKSSGVRQSDTSASVDYISGKETIVNDCAKNSISQRNMMLRTRSNRSKKVTGILLIITISSMLGALPYLVLSILRSGDNVYELRLSSFEKLWYNLFLRSYFFKSATNPVVYGLLDSRFRNAVCRLFRRDK